MLTEIKLLPDYPSASGIEYFDNKFYIIGDDANNLLITDGNFIETDSIKLYSFAEKRIPKKIKADPESITLVKDSGQIKLLLLGSGSLLPNRNVGLLIDTSTKHIDSFRLDTFYQRLQLEGITEINIEGVCSSPGNIILANRGNKNYRKNFLALTDEGFWKNQSSATIVIIELVNQTDSSLFNGVSGITYADKTDQLIISVSTEDTRNTIDDGAIGKSYLWIINNFSTKKKDKTITPDKIIDLEKEDIRFKGQKIESACLTTITDNFLHLVLAADNDNGSSTLFRIELKQK